jgi:hypothetical protein
MRIARLTLVVLAMLSLAAPSHAEPAEPEKLDAAAERTESGEAEPEPGSQQALRFGHQGLEEYERGDYETALSSFQLAESSAHSPVFVLYQARCRLELGQLVRARDLLRQVAEEALSADAPQTWQRAKQEGRRELERVEASIASVVLVMGDNGRRPFDISYSGQTLRISEHRAELDLAPGSHEFRVVDADGKTVRQQVRLEAGERKRRVVFEFPRSEPRAKASAEKPRAKPPPASSPERDEAPGNWGALTALGLGIAATSFGIAAGTVALVKAQDIKSRCPDDRCPASERENVEAARDWANLSSIGFVVGLVGLGSGLLLWDSGAQAAASSNGTLRIPCVMVSGSF